MNGLNWAGRGRGCKGGIYIFSAVMTDNVVQVVCLLLCCLLFPVDRCKLVIPFIYIVTEKRGSDGCFRGRTIHRHERDLKMRDAVFHVSRRYGDKMHREVL